MSNAYQDALLRDPLVIRDSTQANIPPAAFRDHRQETNLYFGTGVSTTQEISKGFPFDMLAMVTVAERARRVLNLGTIYHEISDVHAATNAFVDAKEAGSLARSQREMMQTMCRNLGMEGHYEAILASDYQDSDSFRRAQCEVQEQGVPEDATAYAMLQWAGMRWLQQERGVGFKLSWLVDEKRPGGYDERYFDLNYPQDAGMPLNFIYTPCGRNLDLQRARVCPYSATAKEKRVMLRDGENVRGMFDQHAGNTKKGVRRVFEHYQAIVDNFEDLFGEVEGRDLAGKVESIMREAFGLRPAIPLHFPGLVGNRPVVKAPSTPRCEAA